MTSVRIFAALYVLIYHFWGDSPLAPQAHWYDSWRNGGYLGVSLFFVLSGFILAYNAPVKTQFRRFYALRFARVYPLYLAALLWALPNYLRHAALRPSGAQRWVALPATVLLLQTWFGPYIAVQINSPGWSLCDEAFFYALFPVVLPMIIAQMPRWRMLLAALAVLAILPSTVVHLWVWHHGAAILTDGQAQFVGLPLFRLPEFLTGVVLGRLFLIRMPHTTTLQVAASTALSVACILIHGHLPFDVVRSGLLALPLGWMLYSLAGWRSRFLGSKTMQLLGEMSYGVYLLQLPLLFTVNQLRLPRWQMDLFVSILILPLSYVSYRFIEKAGRLVVLRWLGIRSHPNPIEIAVPA